MLKIYKASAGSGKTYTLAYEYIRTLLGVKNPATGQYRLNHSKFAPDGRRLADRHRHILAITFTNKATEEMKRRIIKELDKLARIPAPGKKDSDYAKTLIKEFGCDRQQLAQSAGKALEDLLDAYSDFNVSTIDSFFQRVLRTFARELDRQGDFSIEISDTDTIQLTVNAMLDDFNLDPEGAPALRKWLVEFMMHIIDDGEKANFLNRNSALYTGLIKLASQICDEKFKPYSADMRSYLGVGAPKDQTPQNLVRTIEWLRESCVRIRQELAGRINKMWDDLDADGVKPEMLYATSMAKKILTVYMPGKIVPTSAELKNKTLGNMISGEKSPFTARFKGNDAHVERVRQELSHAVAAYHTYYDYQILLRALQQLSLLAHAWKYLDDIISENNTLLLSDTNHLLQRIIGADDTPFVYERMGVNLTNFLIDEFQDTSRMQWDNLKPLVAESLGGGHDSLIIGDEKQSIYRFRNSDPSLLHTQVADSDFPDDSVVEGDKPGQNTNWRSAADVVKFNNTLFTILAGKYGIDSYENVIQQIADKKKDLPGYIRFVTQPDNDKEDTSEDEAPRSVIELMARDILRQHDEGDYRWSDIAVLVNRNLEGAKVISELSKLPKPYCDIPVLSGESMLVRSSTAVQMVLSIMRIYTQGHSIIKVDGKSGNISPDAAQTAAIISRYKYLRQRGMPEYEAIVNASDMEVSGGNPAADVINRLTSRRPASLVSLIETIILEFIDADDREKQSAYLTAFVDFAAEWSERYPSSIPAFLDAWETHKNKLSVQSGADIDAVTVMTIHKSKGLEFDCVHIPYGSWEETKGTYQRWVPFPDIKEIPEDMRPPAVLVMLTSQVNNEASIFKSVYEENLKDEYTDNLNKTYVAYTRAGRELTVYYDPKKFIGKALKDAFDKGYDAKGNECMLDLPGGATYDPESGNLSIGAPTVRYKEDEKDETEQKPEIEELDNYNVVIHEKAQVTTMLADILDNSRDIGGEPETDRGDTERVTPDEDLRLRGIALHDIIANVITPDDVGAAMRNYVMRHDISREKEDELHTIIKSMFDMDNALVSRWFADDADVLTEQSIYSPGMAIVPRVDRLVRYADGSADVIDYKFTTVDRHEHKKQIDDHKGQVEDYMDLLRSMGYTEVRGYLWYPLMSPPEIIKV